MGKTVKNIAELESSSELDKNLLECLQKYHSDGFEKMIKRYSELSEKEIESKTQESFKCNCMPGMKCLGLNL